MQELPIRKWGIIISFFYTLILLGIIVPGSMFLAGGDFSKWSGLLRGVKDSYTDGMFWILAVAILASQVLLLFLSVDTSQKRLKHRAHIFVTCAAAAILTALLSSGIVWSLGFAIRGDKFWEHFF